MTAKIVAVTGILGVLALAVSCTQQPPSIDPTTLNFVIEDVDGEEWAHFHDGSFDLHHTVTARITAPDDLRGRIVKLRINALSRVEREAKIGTTWSVPLSPANPDEDQLKTLVYRRITRSSPGS